MTGRDDAVISGRAAEPVGPYPHARRVGDLLFLSGIGPRERGTSTIPGVTQDSTGAVVARDFEVQARAIFANVRAVMDAAGAGWDDIVDVTVFLTHMDEDFAALNRIWARPVPGRGDSAVPDDGRGQPPADPHRHRAQGHRPHEASGLKESR